MNRSQNNLSFLNFLAGPLPRDVCYVGEGKGGRTEVKGKQRDLQFTSCLFQAQAHGSVVLATMCLLTGCYGAAQRAETQHESNILQDLSRHAGAVSTPSLQVAGLRAGVLPRRGAGEEKVREDWVERVL